MKTNFYLIFLVFIIFILAIGSISAGECYQESANESNQTGIDGSCGLNYTGVYSLALADPENETGGTCAGLGDNYYKYGYIYVNYSNLIGANLYGNKWTIKHGREGGNITTDNITISNNCYLNNILMLRVVIYQYPYRNITTYGECYNGSDWNLITSQQWSTTPSIMSSGSNLGYDGNWTTAISHQCNLFGKSIDLPPGPKAPGFYEESISWNITLCGDGILEGLEECDDGNVNNGDGCSSTCLNEVPPPWVLLRNATALSPLCGNGVINGIEECDDGGNVNGDGCDENCWIEPHQYSNRVYEEWMNWEINGTNYGSILPILGNNISISSCGVKANNTAFNNTNWYCTYNYTFITSTTSSIASANLIQSLSSGSAWITIIIIVGFAIVVIALLTEGVKSFSHKDMLPY